MWGHVHPLVVVLVHNADEVAVADVVLVVIDGDSVVVKVTVLLS